RYSRLDRDAEMFASNIDITVDGTSFDLTLGGTTVSMRSPLIGQFNVDNALAASGIARATGLDIKEIAAGLATAPAIPGRMQRVDEGQPFSVIVDYAHTPESLQKLLVLLRSLSPTSRIIAVSGSAGERDVPK